MASHFACGCCVETAKRLRMKRKGYEDWINKIHSSIEYLREVKESLTVRMKAQL